MYLNEERISAHGMEISMDYRFQVKATPFDFFRMSMKKTYRSPLGICNIVFFIAAVLLTVKFFGNAGPLAQAAMVFMCLIIPVIQPLGVYLRSKNYALAIPKGMTLETCEHGILVRVGELSDLVGWNKISKVIDTGDCVILKLSGGTGYFLFNRVLGDRKKKFIDYINRQIG